MAEIVTIRQAVQRARDDDMPVSEYTLRQWIKSGAIPVRKVGQKALLFYPNLIRYLQCEDRKPTPPVAVESIPGIRRIEI